MRRVLLTLLIGASYLFALIGVVLELVGGLLTVPMGAAIRADLDATEEAERRRLIADDDPGVDVDDPRYS